MTSKFEKIALEDFGYLASEYQFRLMETEQNLARTYGKQITYQNKTTAVRVIFQPLDGGIFVDLIRLVNNEIIETPPLIRDDSQLNIFDLATLIELRSPSMVIKQDLKKLLAIDDFEMERVLQEFADQLRRTASDVLRGDFHIFEELGKIVKARASV